MHSLAISLVKSGYQITGSDDKIYNPSLTRLKKYDLLPNELGWFPKKISNDLDVVILGMHAKKNNPELLRAKELNLNIVSYPEFIYNFSKNKTRIVIGGSHGKTTITSMILHVLKDNNSAIEDYRKGKENAVRFLIGQVMKKSRGTANPSDTEKEIIRQLNEK